jgi:adenylate kinase
MGLFLILMGVQGAGKGVQAQYIREHYGGIPHVSTGDLFRAMQTRDDDLARRVQQILKEGRLVDDETTCAIVADRLEKPDAANGVIFDGFPRNKDQADWLADFLAGKGKAVTAVVLLELDLYMAFKRAFGRVTSGQNGASYNIYFRADDIDWEFEDHPEQAYPPRLVATVKATGESLQRRADDANAHAILKRIDTFLESTQPLIDYYDEKGLLRRISADQSVAAVSAAIKAAIEAAKVANKSS